MREREQMRGEKKNERRERVREREREREREKKKIAWMIIKKTEGRKRWILIQKERKENSKVT